MTIVRPTAFLLAALSSAAAIAGPAGPWYAQTFDERHSATVQDGWSKLVVSCEKKQVRVNLHVDKNVAQPLKEGFFIGSLTFVVDGAGEPIKARTSIGLGLGNDSAAFGPLPGAEADALARKIAAARQSIRVAVEDPRGGTTVEHHAVTFPAGAEPTIKATYAACGLKY